MIHVAVLLKPYIDLIGNGVKTIECRLTKTQRAPYEAVSPGERIYFKQSAGPYALTAVADHVLFEDGLTRSRVRELKRDYNEFIHGDAEFWTAKKDANYATLIWLRDVEPIDTGPGIRPLQGQAWWSIDDRAATNGTEEDGHADDADRDDPHSEPPALAFSIEITEGNLRNNSLYVTRVLDRFPSWTLGGRNRNLAARPVTLLLRDGPRVETDIVEDRKLFRARCWGAWFETVSAQPGDHVVFTPIDAGTFFVGLRKKT